MKMNKGGFIQKRLQLLLVVLAMPVTGFSPTAACPGGGAVYQVAVTNCTPPPRHQM
jgi:hypothetical protein